MGEEQPGARLLASLLSRPEQRKVTKAAEVAENVAGAERRSEPRVRVVGEVPGDLAGDLRASEALIGVELAVVLDEGRVVGEQTVVKVARSPEEAVGQIVEFVRGWDRDNRVGVWACGKLVASGSGVQRIDARLRARIDSE